MKDDRKYGAADWSLEQVESEAANFRVVVIATALRDVCAHLREAREIIDADPELVEVEKLLRLCRAREKEINNLSVELKRVKDTSRKGRPVDGCPKAFELRAQAQRAQALARELGELAERTWKAELEGSVSESGNGKAVST